MGKKRRVGSRDPIRQCRFALPFTIEMASMILNALICAQLAACVLGVATVTSPRGSHALRQVQEPAVVTETSEEAGQIVSPESPRNKVVRAALEKKLVGLVWIEHM